MEEWTARNELIILACCSANRSDFPRLLLEFTENLPYVPRPLRDIFLHEHDLESLRELCKLNSFETAMLLVYGNSVGYMLSRGAGGPAYATIYIPDVIEEISFEAEDICLAMLGALALAFQKVVPTDTRVN